MRPKIEKKKEKANVIQVRMTEEQRKLIDKTADSLGLSVSSFLLSSALEKVRMIKGE